MNALDILLPIAAVIALSPLPIIAILMLLGSPGARNTGPAFAAGAVFGLLVLCILAAVIVERIGDISPLGHLILDLLRIVLGLALLWVAWYKWRTRPRSGEAPAVPKHLDAFSTMGPAAAFRLGVFLVGLNPKHIGLVLAAFAALSDSTSSLSENLIAGGLLVVIASIPIVAVTLWHAIARVSPQVSRACGGSC